MKYRREELFAITAFRWQVMNARKQVTAFVLLDKVQAAAGVGWAHLEPEARRSSSVLGAWLSSDCTFKNDRR
jgi:hypothetical protein